MKPTNKDIWKTLGYYLAMFSLALGIILIPLFASAIIEVISKWFE